MYRIQTGLCKPSLNFEHAFQPVMNDANAPEVMISYDVTGTGCLGRELGGLAYGIKASWEQYCTIIRDTQNPLEHLQ